MENNTDLNILQIEFKNNRNNIYQNPLVFPFAVGDFAIVEAEKGIDLGIVKHIKVKVCPHKKDDNVFSVIRRASADDLNKFKQNKEREIEALEFCRARVVERKLDMKVIDVETQFDLNKITFYFTADQRIDFRELVKDLAQQYKTRIELRQIGVRDEAKRYGGVGICGVKLCCTTHLNEFVPICTQYAKEQNLSLNPSKLSGVCGRLMCCLMYERDFYEESLKKFPDIESIVHTPKGKALIEKIDVFKDELWLKYEDDSWEKLTLDDVKKLTVEKNVEESRKLKKPELEECEDLEKLNNGKTNEPAVYSSNNLNGKNNKKNCGNPSSRNSNNK